MNDIVVIFALPIRPGHEGEVFDFARSPTSDPATPDALAEEDITIESAA